MTNTPEINTTPPDEHYVTANCGHEVYEGEHIIDWTEEGKIKTLCADCFMDKIHEMSLEELILRFECESILVRFNG